MLLTVVAGAGESSIVHTVSKKCYCSLKGGRMVAARFLVRRYDQIAGDEKH